MDVIISLIVSVIGAYFGKVDFFVLHTIVSLSLALYKAWLDHTNEKLRCSKKYIRQSR